MVTTGPTERALRTIPVANAAEAFVEMLVHNGVEYLFINSGTDTFPVQEAIAQMMEQERTTPKLILCIDEVTAMFAAQGYFQVTGRPQVVLVHVDAGTAQIGGAYHDVQRDRSGVIVCAGRAPITIGGARPGSKDMVIHWGQEQLDQHGIVRTFVKWDYELRTVDSLNWVVQKAFQVAASEPAGPVYLTLPRELLMTEMESLHLPPAARHAKPIAPAPDPDAVAALAQWLVDAERPLIIAGTPGRYPEAVAPLTELAETIAAPVAGALHTRLNLPTRHFLNAVSCGAPSVSEADVILVLDHDVPWVPDQETLEPGARVGWIDIDPSKDTIPLWTFPADLLIHAASRKALPVLLDAVRERLTDAARERIAARNDRYRANNERRRQEIARQVEALADKRPIDPLYVAACLEQVLDDETIVVNEGMSGGAPFNAYTDRRAPRLRLRQRRIQPGLRPRRLHRRQAGRARQDGGVPRGRRRLHLRASHLRLLGRREVRPALPHHHLQQLLPQRHAQLVEQVVPRRRRPPQRQLRRRGHRPLARLRRASPSLPRLRRARRRPRPSPPRPQPRPPTRPPRPSRRPRHPHPLAP